MRENGIEESIDRPLTIALVVDTVGNQGNGTSNSALQWAAELERQGHHVRLVGIGAPEYPARVNKVPLVSWVAAKQLMQFAEPSDTLFRTAFRTASSDISSREESSFSMESGRMPAFSRAAFRFLV